MGDESVHGFGELHKWLFVVSVFPEITESIDLSQVWLQKSKAMEASDYFDHCVDQAFGI
jgi:hypothetical protein